MSDDNTLSSVLSETDREKEEKNEKEDYTRNHEMVQERARKNSYYHYPLRLSKLAAFSFFVISLLSLVALLPNHFINITSNFYLLLSFTVTMFFSITAMAVRMIIHKKISKQVIEERKEETRENNLKRDF